MQNAIRCMQITGDAAARLSLPSMAAQNKDFPLWFFISAKKTLR